MSELPRHPDAADRTRDATTGDAATAGRRPGWVLYAVGLVIAALVVAVVALHVLGVIGPGAHG